MVYRYPIASARATDSLKGYSSGRASGTGMSKPGVPTSVLPLSIEIAPTRGGDQEDMAKHGSGSRLL
jgi:hypothetical protein